MTKNELLWDIKDCFNLLECIDFNRARIKVGGLAKALAVKEMLTSFLEDKEDALGGFIEYWENLNSGEDEYV